jgi:putative hydrolase of HD superfamily
MKSIARFLFEVGFLHKTPRTGFRFLGSGRESVSEHSFRTALIGWTLSELINGVDPLKLLRMCLLHDLPEARTGDQNYVYKQYVATDEAGACRDLAQDLPFSEELVDLWAEYEEGATLEARAAHDADQLDLLLTLKEQQDMGNPYAGEWISHLLKRLRTDMARALANTILEVDHKDWWFEEHDDWW